MALIPKITLGAPTKRSKNNWSCDSHTTANLGFIQPTFARMLPDRSHIEIKNNTLVYLSPLVNPTFSRLSQRDYYRFVRMTDVYLPWSNFLSKKPFTTEDGTSYIPSELPTFHMYEAVMNIILNNSYVSVTPVGFPDEPIKALSDNNISDFLSAFLPKLQRVNFSDYSSATEGIDNYYLLPRQSEIDDVFKSGSFLSIGEDGKTFEWFVVDNTNNFNFRRNEGLEAVSYTNSDFSFFIPAANFNDVPDIQMQHPNGQSYVFSPKSDGCYMNFRLKPAAKNLRKIFIGLGYKFNPFDSKPKTPFALLAFYKAWFDQFMPQRTIQFTDTLCYKIIKMLESGQSTSFRTDFYYWLRSDLFKAFYYYTAPDYFSASLYNLGDNSLDSSQMNIINSPVIGNIEGSDTVSVVSDTQSASSESSNNIPALAVQLMLRMLRFTNKNNVIGRNIRDYLKVHYGIDDARLDVNQTIKVDDNRVEINTFQIMNQTESSEAFLGEFAGQGRGEKQQSKPTYFDTPDWGFFFCMSTVVPQSGYFQGYIKETTITTPEEFLMPEYDACGYEVIDRGEILSDAHVLTKEQYNDSELMFDTSKGFGFIPRYSHFKINNNIINGDLSLHSTKEGLQGYYMDKMFPTVKEKRVGENGGFELVNPDFLPEVVSDNIRKIDPSDEVGNYNRIFQYQNVDLDHFIIQKVFDVEVTAIWKSLKESFDTVQADETEIERNHQ